MAAVKKSKASSCPISREEFRKEAKDIVITIGNSTVVLDVKEFSTRSLGWGANQKVVITLGDKKVPCQLGLNLTVIGSKELS